jgi:glycosyltransferase involved in cell wall biosynthesis
MPADYSIIIPAWNEEELLPATLASVQAAMASIVGLTGEVIVVDNSSTDATAQIAADAGARVVHEPHRQIARARNAGAKAAIGCYLIFIDADTTIPPALLRSTLDALDSGRCCGGGTQMEMDGPPDIGAAASLLLWNAMSRIMRWAAGAYVYARRDAFEAVGGFDERFYASEELHLSAALRRWGLRNTYAMTILCEPVITSARKVHWFGPRDMLRLTWRLLLRPSRLTDRRFCDLWYRRPDGR